MSARDFLASIMSPGAAGGGKAPVGADEYQRLLEQNMGRVGYDRDAAVRSANIAGGFGNSTAQQFMGGGGGGMGVDPMQTGAVPMPTPRPDMGGGAPAAPDIAALLGPTSVPNSPPTMGPTSVPNSPPMMGPTSMPNSPPVMSPTSMPNSPPMVGPTSMPNAPPAMGPSTMPNSPPATGPTAVPNGPPEMASYQPGGGLTIVPENIGSGIPTPHSKNAGKKNRKKKRSQYALEPSPKRFGR